MILTGQIAAAFLSGLVIAGVAVFIAIRRDGGKG